MRFLFFILISVGGLSASADDDYFPMHVGDEWTMTGQGVSAAGQTVEGVLRIKIQESVASSGKTYFRTRRWTEGLPMDHDSQMLLRKDGKALYSMENTPQSIELLEADLPLHVGARSKRTLGSFTRSSIIKALETIEYQGKSYQNCFHIHYTFESAHPSENYIEDIWQAPNIGMVKLTASGADGTIVFTLKEFKRGE